MLIYKILLPAQWIDLEQKGRTSGAPIDIEDGYIHFSTAAQLRETAAKHFTDPPELIVLACDAQAMDSDLKWEPSRGGALFPHLYRALKLGDVLWHKTVKQGPSGHIFPDDLS